MNRRAFLILVPLLAVRGAGTSVRGKLIRGAGGKASLQLADGRLIALTGDADTQAVLNDSRLTGFDIEIIGAVANGTATIDPIHTAAIWAHNDGKRLRITYWCDVCAIRTYTPGLCQCCREETVLELREPDTVSTK